MQYPKWKYKKSDHPAGFDAVLVKSQEHDEKLGDDHFDSPAEFGLETHPAKDYVKPIASPEIVEIKAKKSAKAKA